MFATPESGSLKPLTCPIVPLSSFPVGERPPISSPLLRLTSHLYGLQLFLGYPVLLLLLSWIDIAKSRTFYKMSGDASLPPNAPVANGLNPGHGEADASTTTLSQVCADMHSRVSAFLSAAPKSDIKQRTQEQTRNSLDCIEKALRDYEYVIVPMRMTYEN